MNDTSQNLMQVAIVRTMGGLVFDAVFEESHESDLEVTDNPVETGVVVSDHAYMKPLKVTLSAGVSDTPLNPVAKDKFAGVSRGEAQTIHELLPDAFIYDSRPKQAFKLLQELQKKAEPFSLQTGLKLYSNMVCTSIRTSQDKDSVNVLVFQAELREVLIVNTKNATYTPKPKPGPTARQTKPKNDRGEQQGKEVTDPNKRSFLIKMFSKNVKGG